MTSFSDAGLWQPFVPPSVGGIALVPSPAVAPALEPAAPSEPTADWLRPLHTDFEIERIAAVDAVRDEAFRRGADEASHRERARADERCATALQAVARAAAHLEQIAAEFARDRERDVQAVALAAARAIVQHELTIDALRVGELVKRAIEQLPLDHVLEVRLHPDDLATLGASLEGLVPAGRTVTLQWLSDPSIERGGFVIETPHRIVDGRTDVALRALYERFDRE